jgi:hypothetical protein
VKALAAKIEAGMLARCPTCKTFHPGAIRPSRGDD